jgi:hypothetical protein
LINKYAIQFAGEIPYEHLGASCVMSVVNTVDTIIGASEYLNGKFIMLEQIRVERLASWFIRNKNYDCGKSILTFFIANYIKRKINELYRSINKTDQVEA